MIQYLSFDESDVQKWVADYIRFNFAHYDNKFKSLIEAVK